MMNHKLTFLVVAALFLSLFLMPSHASKKKSAVKTLPKKIATYTYTDRHFSFSLPIEWTQQNGDVDSGRMVFVAPKNCSFEVNISLMQPDFNAEQAVVASLKTATKDIAQGNNISAKRRDESGIEKGKPIKFARGWEAMEKAKDNYQRIIYQAYDRENYAFYFSAAAEAVHFEECRPELQNIIRSINFGD